MSDASQPLTERQLREREYYDQYSAISGETVEVCFDPIAGHERRPWNSYWYVYQLVQEHFDQSPKRALDFGCGPGHASVIFSKIGYEVWGFDVSPNNIKKSTALAHKYGCADRIHLDVSTAEQLNYPKDFFDVIVGIDILHHVDIPMAIARCKEILKPGGLAIFHEPVEAPIFDPIRNSKFGRWLVPNEASLDKHITHDERKLNVRDFAAIKEHFPNMVAHPFRLFSRIEKVCHLPALGNPYRVEQFDQTLFRILPISKRLSGTTVLELRKD